MIAKTASDTVAQLVTCGVNVRYVESEVVTLDISKAFDRSLLDKLPSSRTLPMDNELPH